MADEEKDEQKGREQQILTEMRERFQLCCDAESDQRAKSLDDLEFMCEENQWPRRAQIERQAAGRPTLVVNRMDQFVQHITNGMRQNRVAARVFPVDDNADPETAKVIQGIIRNIEYQSSADLAYDTAAFYAVACGFGYFRVLPEYSDPKSHDQDLRIRRIKNPFTVYLDPNCQDPTGADAEFGFIVTDYTKDEFEKEFPDSRLAGESNFESIGDSAPKWITKDGCRVAEYYFKEYKREKLYRLKAGEDTIDVLESDLEAAKGRFPKGVEIVAERETKIPTGHYVKSNGIEILQHTTLASPQIPIFRIVGNELDINGKTLLKGIVRNLKDAQRQYNYMLTAQTEAAMDTGGVVVAEGAVEGHEQEWKNRLRKNQAYLQYKPTSINGQPAGPPQRLTPDMTIQAKSEARLMAADDLKALTGIYDSALGARSNETSGKAIFQRQQQSETANYHFEDNKTRAIAASTKLIVDLIPTYYDTKRTVRILGDDESQKLVKVNQPWQENGEDVLYDLTTGKYDVICTAGPAFATKRLEAAQVLVQLAQAAPVIMQAAPDIVMKCMDIPYSQELAERMKKTLPPGLAEEEGQTKVPPQLQAAMQQAQVENQALNAHAQQLEQKIQELEFEKKAGLIQAQIQLEGKRMDNETKLAVAEVQTKMQSLSERMGLIADMFKQLGIQQHQYAMATMQQQHERIMAPDPDPAHEAQESPEMEAQEHATGMEMVD